MLLWLKRATVTPLLRRYGLDKVDVKNYRHMYNIPFIYKFIEKAVARRIEEQLEH